MPLPVVKGSSSPKTRRYVKALEERGGEEWKGKESEECAKDWEDWFSTQRALRTKDTNPNPSKTNYQK